MAELSEESRLWKGPEYRLLLEAEHNVIRGAQENPQAGTKTDHVFTAGSQAYNYNMKFGSST
ncbi:hypothetical protein DPMN_110964, partial [Dreissena polymorpha]